MDKMVLGKAVTAGIIGGLLAQYGWFIWLVLIFAICIAIDYASGTMAALKNGVWSSSVARSGIWHKAGAILVVAVSGISDIIIGIIVNNMNYITLAWHYTVLISPVVLVWYIVTELGSIIENADKLGANTPVFLRKMMNVFKGSIEAAADKIVPKA